MRRPSLRLIIAFLISLAIGYAVSWGIMVGLLKTEIRLYGFVNLFVIAVLVAFLLIILLDSPFKLKTFEWSETKKISSESHFIIVIVLVAIVTILVANRLTTTNLLPPLASREGVSVDWLFGLHLQVIAFLFALIMVFILYSVVVFRRKPGEKGDGDHFRGNYPLEIAWTVIPLLAVLYFSYLGVITLKDVMASSEDELEVEVISSQWSWRFDYPEFGLSSTELNLPKDRKVLLNLSSTDVIHDFWVPEFRVKQDAVPGKIKPLRITPTEVGAYKVRCAELCGLNHAFMVADVNVMETADFEAWVTQETQPLTEAEGTSAAERGRKVAELNACISCHSVDGNVGAGPTWLGLYGSEENLDDGTTVTIDDEYLRESIIDPGAKITQGFQNIMPPAFGEMLSEEQIDDVIEFIKSLNE